MFLRLCRLMCGRSLTFRQDYSFSLGLCPVHRPGRSPKTISALLRWGTATTAHQAAKPQRAFIVHQLAECGAQPPPHIGRQSRKELSLFISWQNVGHSHHRTSGGKAAKSFHCSSVGRMVLFPFLRCWLIEDHFSIIRRAQSVMH